MGDLIRTLGDIRVNNLAEDFGTRAESVELILAVVMMLGGILLTYLVQQWADKAGEVQSAANVGRGGGLRTHQDRGIRE